GYLLKRPIGRPPNEVRRFHANFSYQAGTWTKPRRVIAKVEWHPGELYPRVGFIGTNMSRPAERVVAFYNKRGTCEQGIKEGKGRSAAGASKVGRHVDAERFRGFEGWCRARWEDRKAWDGHARPRLRLDFSTSASACWAPVMGSLLASMIPI